jgi:hypothetical protein
MLRVDLDNSTGVERVRLRLSRPDLGVGFDADHVNPGEIKSIRELLDPRWKGKLVGPDPRTRGAGFNPATAMRVKTKDDSLVERLYKGQAVQLVDDARQQVEALVRGQFAVHVGGITQTILSDFQAQGVGQECQECAGAGLRLPEFQLQRRLAGQQGAAPQCSQGVD